MYNESDVEILEEGQDIESVCQDVTILSGQGKKHKVLGFPLKSM